MYNNGTTVQNAPWFKFTDLNKKQIGEIQQATDFSNIHCAIVSPVAPAGTKAIISISFNNQ
jgi:hypothetical protein